MDRVSAALSWWKSSSHSNRQSFEGIPHMQAEQASIGDEKHLGTDDGTTAPFSEPAVMDIDGTQSDGGNDDSGSIQEQSCNAPNASNNYLSENSFFTDALEETSMILGGDIEEARTHTDLNVSHSREHTTSPAKDLDEESNPTSSDSEPSQDLFSSTFGQDADRDHDGDSDNDSNDDSEAPVLDDGPQAPRSKHPAPESAPPQPSPQAAEPEPEHENLFLKTLRDQGYDFVPCEHSGCNCDPIVRLSTPPYLPEPYVPTTQPRLPDALGPDLLAQQRWHARASTLRPQLSARDPFDAGRRYWIAVLIQGRHPGKAASGREYVWMKGNRFSTVATVWHHYQTTTMADADDLVLLLGYRRPGPEEQMQDLDFFGDRLVVFRAVGKGHPDAQGRGPMDGLEPEVIELD